MSPTEEHVGLTDRRLLLQNNSFTFVREVLHHSILFTPTVLVLDWFNNKLDF